MVSVNQLIGLEELVIPDNMPQPKEVYIEQINILRPILLSESSSNNQIIPKAVSTHSASTSTLTKGKTTDTSAKPGTMLDKLEKNSPYNLFFTVIPKSPETGNEINSLTFTG